MNLLTAGAAVLRTIRRNSPIILSAAAGLGLVLVYCLTIKETEEIKEEMDEMTEEEVHSFKMVKKIVKTYAPSFLLLVFTMFCIVQTTVISQHRIRDLTTYSAGLAAYYQQYRSKNVELNGSEKDHEIMKEIAKDQINDISDFNVDEGILCQMAGYSHYFSVSDLTKIYNAFSQANERYIDKGSGQVTVKKVLELAGAKEFDEWGCEVPFDKYYTNYGWETHELTKDYAVSMLYPYIGKVEEESGLEYYFIDIPLPQPLELIGW